MVRNLRTYIRTLVTTYINLCVHSVCVAVYVRMYVLLSLLYVRMHVQAYSVYDREVGYCQGSPFIAGVLLLHVRGGGGRGGEVL